MTPHQKHEQQYTTMTQEQLQLLIELIDAKIAAASPHADSVEAIDVMNAIEALEDTID